MIFGNMRLRAAEALGWKTIPCATVDLDEARAAEWLVKDNVSYGEWDDQALAELLFELEQSSVALLPLTGFADDELERLLDSVRGDSQPPNDPDAVPPLPAEPTSKLGEVYELGPHRLLCGDAMKAEDVVRLMSGAKADVILTDPPYGIALDTDYSKITGSANSIAVKRGNKRVLANTYRPVEGDTRPFDAAPLSVIFADVSEQFWFGANYYRRTLPGDDLSGSWLVWDKRPSGWNDDGAGIDDVIGAGFELIWSRQKHQQRVMRQQWSGFTARNPGMERAHPTEKPVALLADILTRWSPANGVVVDPFAGSGTTIIAAEQLGRCCYAMEIDPAYCDVIRQRYEEFVADKG